MKFYKPFLLLLTIMGATLFAQAQTNYDKGYKDGFAKAYCYNQSINCIPKAPVFVPLPRVQESSSSYQNGYDRGYAEGLEFRRNETNNSNDKTSVKFNPYISQIPTNGLSILAYKERLYNERADWIRSTINQTEDFFVTIFIPVDPELSIIWIKARNEWVTENLDNKKPDLSDNDIFRQIQTFFSKYTSDIINSYTETKNIAESNSINVVLDQQGNYPKPKNYSAFITKGVATFYLDDKETKPEFNHTFKVTRDGKETELHVVYFKMYDKYFFYYNSWIVELEQGKSFVNIAQYEQGGSGYPIIIKLSDKSSILYDKGVFIEEVTEQLYDEKADQFLADRFVMGTCPKCGNEEAYGDQCEKCGSTLNATDLINPKSTITGTTPIKKETKHWFLPLDRYSDFLNDWILVGHRNDWKPNVYGQVKSWIDGGLEPRAVTRDLDWGIDVPVEGAEGKKLYVWFDAPIGNSLKSDVLPVLDMGGYAVHVPFHTTWEHEKISHKVEHPNFKTIEKITEVLPFLIR